MQIYHVIFTCFVSGTSFTSCTCMIACVSIWLVSRLKLDVIWLQLFYDYIIMTSCDIILWGTLSQQGMVDYPSMVYKYLTSRGQTSNQNASYIVNLSPWEKQLLYLSALMVRTWCSASLPVYILHTARPHRPRHFPFGSEALPHQIIFLKLKLKETSECKDWVLRLVIQTSRITMSDITILKCCMFEVLCLIPGDC